MVPERLTYKNSRWVHPAVADSIVILNVLKTKLAVC